MLFDTGWKTFEIRFDSILSSLSQHRDLVDREAASFDMVDAVKARAKIDKEITKAEGERETSHLNTVLAWLRVDQCLQEDHRFRLSEKRSDKTCDWVFSHTLYQSWHRDSQRPLLWLTGIPGSGMFSRSHIPLRKQSGSALSIPTRFLLTR